MKYFRIVAYFFTLVMACGKEKIQRIPSLLIVGKSTGEILKCELENPDKCQTIYTDPSKSQVTSTVVRGEYLYTSNDLGHIHRCQFYAKHSCTIFDTANGRAESLAAVGEYLFVGLLDGTILRCSLNQPNSCSSFYTVQEDIRNIFEYGEYIYIATFNSLSYCQKDVAFSCVQLEINDPLLSFPVWAHTGNVVWAHTGNVVVAFHSFMFYLTSYNLTSKDTLVLIQKVNVLADIYHHHHIYSIAIMKRIIYVLSENGDIKTCEADKASDFKNVTRHKDAVSITTVYGVHRVRNGYDIGRCDQRPLTVFNYDVERRAMLEVSVVDGKLRDARGATVDTRHADRGYSGHAAVFAMGPDGQLLLSNAHGSGLVHVSSLFAGHPVAGAGEIIVEDGVVKRIIACSTYYWPDVQLNGQVVDELIRKGYHVKRAEEISLEECAYTCDSD